MTYTYVNIINPVKKVNFVCRSYVRTPTYFMNSYILFEYVPTYIHIYTNFYLQRRFLNCNSHTYVDSLCWRKNYIQFLTLYRYFTSTVLYCTFLLKILWNYLQLRDVTLPYCITNCDIFRFDLWYLCTYVSKQLGTQKLLIESTIPGSTVYYQYGYDILHKWSLDEWTVPVPYGTVQ